MKVFEICSAGLRCEEMNFAVKLCEAGYRSIVISQSVSKWKQSE